MGRFQEACDLLQDLSVPWVGSGPRAALALVYVARHEDARVAELLLEFEAAGDRFSVGLIHAARGDVDRAFDAFGRVDCWGDYWPILSVHQYYPDVLGPLRADPRFHRVEKDSKEWVDRLPADAKSRLDSAVEGGKQALRTGDPDAIRKALDELNNAYSAAGASLYQAGQAQEQAAGAGAGQTGPEAAAEGTQGQEDVVEADYEIVDENKK